MKNLFDLTGKTALITGGNKGIGKAMALALAGAGADIVIVSGSVEQEGSIIAQEIVNTGRNCKTYRADLTDRVAIRTMVATVLADCPQVDILVNNAGAIIRSPVTEHTDEQWDKVLSLNLDAAFILAREFGRHMILQGGGKIIFTCSLLSFQGGVNVPGYAASKGALSSLVKALANEWGISGVNVNGIVPGYIATDNTFALRADEDRSRSILERIPAGRWGEPEDLAGPVVFLASEASSYMHGHLLVVDGGWMGR